MSKPRIAIPIPTSFDIDYNERTWPNYASAVEQSGGEPVAIPLDQPPAETAQLLATCSGVLLPGSGADVNTQKYGQQRDPESADPDPSRENVDELLLQDAHNMGKPILAICFGTQMLNVWRGGTLVQHLSTEPVAHSVPHELVAHKADVTPQSLLAEVVTSSSGAQISINSSHHQAIATPGDGLRVSALSPEDGIVEAVEGTPDGVGGRFVLGVQWHPERTFDTEPASRALFARFVSEAEAWSPKAPSTGGQFEPSIKV